MAIRLTQATIWEGYDETSSPGASPRPRAARERRTGCDFNRRSRCGGYDLRQFTRRGQEGPGRAEGCESSRREPAGAGSGRRLRSGPRHDRADDRGGESSWLSVIGQSHTLYTGSAARTLRLIVRCTHHRSRRSVEVFFCLDGRDVSVALADRRCELSLLT